MRKCHRNGSAIQRSTGARRSLLDNRCNMASRELIGPADLTRAQFVVSMKCQFSQKLVRMGALRGPTRVLFYSFPNSVFN